MHLGVHECNHHHNIGSGNGLLPVLQQAIAWTDAELFSSRPPEASFTGIQILQNFQFNIFYL